MAKTSRTRKSLEAAGSAAPGAVVLALDLQARLLDVLPDAAGVRRRCHLLLEAASGLGIPIVFTEQVPAKLGRTAPDLLAAAPSAKVFAKSTFSAVADEAVLGHLRGLGCEHLLLCGIETPICVYQTALNALAEDFQVTLLVDAIGARRSADASHCLRELGASGVHLLPVETVLYALMYDAQHPFFKKLTQLVKTHHVA